MEPITNTEIEQINAKLMPLELDKETHNRVASEICGVLYPKIEGLQKEVETLELLNESRRELLTGALKVIASHSVFTGWKEIDAIAGEWRELEEKHGELLKQLNQ